jgi:hypothetical protein
MKFSEIPIGARFIDKKFSRPEIILKTPLFDIEELIEGEIEDLKANSICVKGSYYFYKDDAEVELVSKCENCKYSNQCSILFSEIEIDKSTFSCSEFQMKVGG